MILTPDEIKAAKLQGELSKETTGYPIEMAIAKAQAKKDAESVVIWMSTQPDFTHGQIVRMQEYLKGVL